MKRRTKIKLTLLAAMMLICFTAFILVWNGIVLLNNPSSKRYPVRGVDVSSYQGDIDWEVLSKQNIDFAFMKATEGSLLVDAFFEYNYTQAQKTNLRIGAYHFFSFDSSGKTQADNFIATVPIADNMLPPVVDFEFYGDKEQNLPDVRTTQEQLNIMLDSLEAYYNMRPIIYATEKSYDIYLSGHYDDYDIWIRNVICPPALSDNRQWTFWQYTNRAQLGGYRGSEKFIDMNVFHGTIEAFENYAK